MCNPKNVYSETQSLVTTQRTEAFISWCVQRSTFPILSVRIHFTGRRHQQVLTFMRGGGIIFTYSSPKQMRPSMHCEWSSNYPLPPSSFPPILISIFFFSGAGKETDTHRQSWKIDDRYCAASSTYIFSTWKWCSLSCTNTHKELKTHKKLYTVFVQHHHHTKYFSRVKVKTGTHPQVTYDLQSPMGKLRMLSALSSVLHF